MPYEDVAKTGLDARLANRSLHVAGYVVRTTTPGHDRVFALPNHDSCMIGAGGRYGSPKRRRIVFVLPNQGIEMM